MDIFQKGRRAGMGATSNGGRWHSPYFFIFVLILLIGACFLLYRLYLVVSGWILPFVIVFLLIGSGLLGWKAIKAITRHAMEVEEKSKRNALLTQELAARQNSLAFQEETVLLVQEARAAGSNVDIEFNGDGTLSSIKVIPANPQLSLLQKQIEEMKERLNGPDTPQIAAPTLPKGKQLALPSPGAVHETYDLMTVFKNGHFDMSRFFLGYLDGGEPLFIDAENDFFHAAINAISGRGKTITKRAIEGQLIAYGAEVYDLDPKFTLEDEKGLDYRPLAARLMAMPQTILQDGTAINHLEMEPARIIVFLEWLALVEIPRRLVRYHAGKHDHSFMYVFIEEYLFLSSQYKQLKGFMEIILPVARSLKIKIFVCAQNFQTQSTDLPGGLIENFETAYYIGGDDKSGSKLLDIGERDLREWLQAYNVQLGKGIALLRNNSVLTPARLLTMGFSSNAWLYYMLGAVPDFSFSHTAVPDSFKQAGTGAGSPIRRAFEVPGATVEAAEIRDYRIRTGELSGPVVSAINPLDRRVPETDPGSPAVPGLGPNDKAMTPEQETEFLRFYRHKPGPVKSVLRYMNGGRGLGNAYAKHASWIIKNNVENR
jgi:FtsZ-binding cell division protein ZapB